jgi:hypothetical protein
MNIESLSVLKIRVVGAYELISCPSNVVDTSGVGGISDVVIGIIRLTGHRIVASEYATVFTNIGFVTLIAWTLVIVRVLVVVAS